VDISPLGNRITLQVPKAPDKIGSLWVPEQAKETYTLCQATIVAVGPKVRDVRLAPGLRVIVKRFGGFPHDAERTTWTVYEDNVLAILDEGAL
jgi:co-chaperonin GroES (HSP10)